MDRSPLERMSLQGRDLRYNLLIIASLLFVLPFGVILYLSHHQNGIDIQENAVLVILVLLLIFTGLSLLRRIFDGFGDLSEAMARADAGEAGPLAVRTDTAELREISQSFNRVLQKFERVHADLAQRVLELDAFREMTELAGRTLEVDALLTALLHQAMALTGAATGSVFHVGADGALLHMATAGERRGQKDGGDLDLRAAAVAFFTGGRGGMRPHARSGLGDSPDIPTCLGMPIRIAGDVQAVLVLFRPADCGGFAEQDVARVDLLVSHARFALENGRLHQTIENQSHLLQRRNESLLGEIHARETMEHSLREAQEDSRRYAFIVNTAKDFMTLVNRQYVYEAVSASYCEAHRRRREEVVGKTVEDLWGRDAFPLLRPYFDRCFTGKTVQYQAVFSFNDREARHYDVSYHPYRNRQGEVTHAVVVTHDIHEHVLAKEALQRDSAHLRQTVEGLFQTINSVIALCDPLTAEHHHRTAALARDIALEMGLPQKQTDAVYLSAIIHDIGKLYVPPEILGKPGLLTEAETRTIQSHAANGCQIFKNVLLLPSVAETVQQHHERLDGSGYPRGLRGEAICLEAQILAVADVVEAMSSQRAYRPRLGRDLAVEEIRKNSGVLYHPRIVAACLAVLQREKAPSENGWEEPATAPET